MPATELVGDAARALSEERECVRSVLEMLVLALFLVWLYGRIILTVVRGKC